MSQEHCVQFIYIILAPPVRPLSPTEHRGIIHFIHQRSTGGQDLTQLTGALAAPSSSSYKLVDTAIALLSLYTNLLASLCK